MTVTRFFKTNVLYCGDNLEWLGNHIPDESVDLIYLDPPFFSNRNYEVIWGDEAEVRSFEDRWDAGLDGYINWMEERATELYRVLKPGGSFYLHCDWHAGHYLKVMLDGEPLFGGGSFRNEIIWKRTSGHSDAGRYGNVHDTILYYVKEGSKPTWNDVYQPYDESYVRQYYRYQDSDGRRWMSGDLSAAGLAGGGYEYEWNDVTRVWRLPRTTMERLDQEGRIYYTRNKIARIKRYLDESKGLPAQDVWTDLEALRSWHQERLGYPTQKPESLLARIIAASSNPDDVILDPFCGCGTTVAVAHMMGRQWIGMDISPTAVNLMKLRLQKLGAVGVDPIGLPQSVAALKTLKPFEFQNWVIQQLYGTHSKRKSRDMGIDGYSFFVNDPIQVKRSERVGRPAVDAFETAVKRAKKDKGYVVAFSFTSDARKEAARARRADKLDIRLITVEEILDKDKLGTVVTPLPGQPVPGQVAPDVPLPESPPKEARPTGEELIESDQEAGEVA